MSEPRSSRGPGAWMAPGGRAGGKYRLLRRVAAGGMGEVWRARNEATGADVALKFVHESADGGTGERLRSEARLGAMLSHRNIVKVFDLLEEPGGTLVLVMELLRGESLGRWLERRGPLTAREAVAIAVPLLSALGHAHASGVVHRDVTPANVFLSVDPDGFVTPKLVDFGIAKLPSARSQTLPGSVLGTPRYMSPEQIRSTEVLDGRSDLFSVGAVMVEMMTGASPFDAPSPSASLALVLETPADPDPAIDPRVWIVLAKALAKRPYERHCSAAEMAAALCTAVGETETSLAPLLKRDPPGPNEVDDGREEPPPSDRVTSVEGQSLDPPRARPRGRWAWIGGVGAAAGVAAILSAALQRPADVRAASSAPAPTPPSASPETRAPDAGESLPPNVSAPTASASVDAPRRPTHTPLPTPSSPRTQPTQPRAARPATGIATTPGF